MRLLKIIRDLQPLIIGLLFLLLYLQYQKHNNYKLQLSSDTRYVDSLGQVNSNLQIEMLRSGVVIDSLESVKSNIKVRIVNIEGSISSLDKKRKDEKNIINILNIDSNIVILSRNLSKKNSIR